MHELVSRKDRQYSQIEKAAKEGKTQISLKLYKGEAKYWARNGLSYSPDDVVVFDDNLGLYLVILSFDFPHLLNFESATKYIIGISDIPSDLSLGEKFYLISQKSIYKMRNSK